MHITPEKQAANDLMARLQEAEFLNAMLVIGCGVLVVIVIVQAVLNLSLLIGLIMSFVGNARRNKRGEAAELPNEGHSCHTI